MWKVYYRLPIQRNHPQERPCAKACGMNAIRSDEYGRADIDQEKCVSCRDVSGELSVRRDLR